MLILKKISRRHKSMENYQACKEINGTYSPFSSNTGTHFFVCCSSEIMKMINNFNIHFLRLTFKRILLILIGITERRFHSIFTRCKRILLVLFGIAAAERRFHSISPGYKRILLILIGIAAAERRFHLISTRYKR